jgi:hypothetical protein
MAIGDPSWEDTWEDARKDVWEDKTDFLNKLDDIVFEKMKEYNEQEEERIKNGKETKDYVTTADVVEKMKNLGWKKVV